MEYLTELFHTGLGHSALNTARSALSALCSTDNSITIGAQPLVTRFMKGVYNLRPTRSRYNHIWDVNKVLEHLKTWSPLQDLTLKTLTLKLVMLIALVTASRGQSLKLLNLNNLTATDDSFTFNFNTLLKQSRPGYVNPSARLLPYTPDKRLCVCDTMTEYLSRTKKIRDPTEGQLFISYVKPFKAVSKATISRWIHEVMGLAGIDTDQFKPHSVRAAATSKAKERAVPIHHILQTAGWRTQCTFAKFYDKPIQNINTFADSILSNT